MWLLLSPQKTFEGGRNQSWTGSLRCKSEEEWCHTVCNYVHPLEIAHWSIVNIILCNFGAKQVKHLVKVKFLSPEEKLYWSNISFKVWLFCLGQLLTGTVPQLWSPACSLTSKPLCSTLLHKEHTSFCYWVFAMDVNCVLNNMNIIHGETGLNHGQTPLTALSFQCILGWNGPLWI